MRKKYHDNGELRTYKKGKYLYKKQCRICGEKIRGQGLCVKHYNKIIRRKTVDKKERIKECETFIELANKDEESLFHNQKLVRELMGYGCEK